MRHNFKKDATPLLPPPKRFVQIHDLEMLSRLIPPVCEHAETEHNIQDWKQRVEESLILDRHEKIPHPTRWPIQLLNRFTHPGQPAVR